MIRRGSVKGGVMWTVLSIIRLPFFRCATGDVQSVLPQRVTTAKTLGKFTQRVASIVTGSQSGCARVPSCATDANLIHSQPPESKSRSSPDTLNPSSFTLPRSGAFITHHNS
jgi:hypothetical protein